MLPTSLLSAIFLPKEYLSLVNLEAPYYMDCHVEAIRPTNPILSHKLIEYHYGNSADEHLIKLLVQHIS
jgi:hypothetical protein